MRKLESKYDGIIDNLISFFIPSHSKYLNNLTPNQITTISVFFSILTIFFYYKKYYLIAGITFILSYIYDCLDGYHARRKNMITKKGDWYDHITDVLFNNLIFLMIFNNFRKTKYLIYICIIFIFLLITTSIHFGCQEQIYKKKNKFKSTYFNSFISQCLNKKNPSKILQYSRYFSSGMLILYMTILILLTKNID